MRFMLIACPAPACETLLDEDDLWGQIEHIERLHPEIVAERLSVRKGSAQ